MNRTRCMMAEAHSHIQSRFCSVQEDSWCVTQPLMPPYGHLNVWGAYDQPAAAEVAMTELSKRRAP